MAERKSWAGVALADRQAARRAELIRVGIELLGATGGPAVSVRAVCRAAALTERYFYESFTDRDQFVRTVYDEVGAEAHAALVRAVESATADAHASHGPRAVAQAAVSAFVALTIDDPAVGRVLLLAPEADPALRGKGVQLLPTFVSLLHEQLRSVPDEVERQLTAIGLVGALTQLFASYLDGAVSVSRDRFVAHLVDLVLTANRTPN